MDKGSPENFTPEETQKWVILSIVVGLILYILSQLFINEERAAVFSVTAPLMILIIRLYWRLKRESWFWILIAMIFALDVTGVFLMPIGQWPNSFVVLAPLAAAQLAISVSLISTMEAVIRKRKALS